MILSRFDHVDIHDSIDTTLKKPMEGQVTCLAVLRVRGWGNPTETAVEFGAWVGECMEGGIVDMGFQKGWWQQGEWRE